MNSASLNMVSRLGEDHMPCTFFLSEPQLKTTVGSWFFNPLRLSDFCPITYKQNYQNGSYNFEVFWVQISTTFEQKNPTKILEDFLFEMQNSNGLWKDWDLGTFLGQFLGQYLGNIWGNFWGNIWAISRAISRAISGAIFWAISYNSKPFF